MALAYLGVLRYLLIGVSIFVVLVNCTETSNQEGNVRVKRGNSVQSDLEVLKIQNRELLGHLADTKNELTRITTRLQNQTSELQNQFKLLNTEVQGKIEVLVAADVEKNSLINASMLDIAHMKDSIQELNPFIYQLLYDDANLPFQICSKMMEAGEHEQALKFVQRTKAQIEKKIGTGSDAVVRLSLCEARAEMANNSISGIQNLRAIYEAAKRKHGSDHPLVKEIYEMAPTNCCSIQQAGYKRSGVYHGLWEISCDLETSGGGWTLIQRREAKPLTTDEMYGWYASSGDINSAYWIGWFAFNFLQQRQLLRVERINERNVSTDSVYEVQMERFSNTLRIFNNSETAGGVLSVAESVLCSRFGEIPFCGPCVYSSSNGWWERKCGRNAKNWVPSTNFGQNIVEMKIRPHGFPKGCLTS